MRALFKALAAALLLIAPAGPAWAQTKLPPPPTDYALDERGVDVARGMFVHSVEQVAIGSGPGALSFVNTFTGDGWRDNHVGTLNIVGAVYTVSIGPISSRFTLSSGSYVPDRPDGSSLTFDGVDTYTYTSPGGVEATFQLSDAAPLGLWQGSGGLLKTLTQPNGEKATYSYTFKVFCPPMGEPEPCHVGDEGAERAVRLASVDTNTGYMLHFDYAVNAGGSIIADREDWVRRTKVTAINLAEEYCAPGSMTCSGLTRAWPSVSYGGSDFNFTSATDQSSRVTNYTYGVGGITSITLPGSGSADLTLTYSSGRVATVNDGAGTWTYSYADATDRTTTVAAPSSTPGSTVYRSSLTTHQVTSVTNALNEERTFAYDGDGRLITVTEPEDNATAWAYDARGNIEHVTTTNKAADASIRVSMTYPAGPCSPDWQCNLPSSVTPPYDPAGSVPTNVTEMTYTADGLLASVTGPEPTSGADRPQTRYAYEAQYAWFKNSSGVQAQAPTPVILLEETSACSVGESCDGTDEEVLTTYVYGSTGVANNLATTAVTSGAGDASVTATTAMTWTPDGDLATVDGPLSGADETHYRYDGARQLIGVVGPDPDDAGPLAHRAVRNTYNGRGQVTLAEQGTVDGYSDPDWAAFDPLQQVATAYDSIGRPSAQRLQAGGTTYGLTQQSYDARNRVTCQALRMNPAAFASPPSSACTLSTAGAFGDDRITAFSYDAADQITGTTSGYATADTVTEAATYTANGWVETLTDGEGNVSTYVYDGFDRVERLRYPNAGGSGSSTTDYEGFTYDVAGNMVTHRNREDANTFTATFDALNRMVALDAPSGSPDVDYAYDLLGRPLSAVSTGAGAQTLAWTWDALGRHLTETSPLGTLASQYDPAGRRTRITWPDTFYAVYDWDLAGQITAIRANGVTSGPGVLGTYAYDDLGRRTSVERGNGVDTAWGYDPASRLTSLAQDMDSTASDVTFGYAPNPAGQIVERDSSNAAWSYLNYQDEDLDYTINGLNQATAIDLSSLVYDGRGNLTDDGVNDFEYDAYNRLIEAVTAAGTSDYQFDPLGRLYRETSPTGGGKRFVYDGTRIVGEYTNAGNMSRRYVPGPGVDETLAYYFSDGTTVFQPITDERGSVIAYTTSSGNVTGGINTYDEFGVPDADPYGRFQYTGQARLTDTPLYHYKARAYHPQIGRFLTADPIGYAGGANLYAYVLNDPVNLVDPSGLVAEDTVGEVVVIGSRYCGGDDSFDICIIDPSGPAPGWGAVTTTPGIGEGPQDPESQQSEEMTPQERCQSYLDPGDTRFYCDVEGRQQISPEYQEQACENYRAMMQSNREVGRWTSGWGLGTGVVRLFITTPRAFGVFGLALAGPTFGLSFSPPPPGCTP